MGSMPTPDELAALDGLLTQDERDTAATVRAVLDEHVRPHIGQWYLDGQLPARDLAKIFGDLGLLGMHLEGYGCAGATATMYGVACRELEAADGGVRSLVSVQGSLAMYAVHRFGSEEQKQQWLPRMAAGEAIGCFGLTEPDAGSDPSSMRTRARRDGDDWVLDGAKMWITNAPVADVAVVWAKTEEGVRGFVVPTNAPGFSAPRGHGQALAPRVRHGPDRARRRAGAGGRRPARGPGAPRAVELPDRGQVRDHLGCDRRDPGLPRRRRSSTPAAGSSSAARSPASS